MVPYRRKYTKKAKTTKRKSVSTISTLSKQVRALQKKTALVTEKIQYRVAASDVTVSSPFVARNLSNYSTWSALFPSTLAGNERSSMVHRYLKIDNLVTHDGLNNEEETINYTYMIISRRDTSGTAVDISGNLVLVENTDYSSQSGIAYLNLKKWRVRYSKRFTLTQMNIDSALGQDSAHAFKRFQATVKLGFKVTNPDGFWLTMTNSPNLM